MADSSPVADRNLLFGVVALRRGFITREQLVDALGDWMDAKDAPLAEILQRRGSLTDVACVAVDALVAMELDQRAAREWGDDQTVGVDGAPPRPAADLQNQPTDFADNTILAGPGMIGQSSFRNEAADESGRYSLVRLHSAGAMGEVFVARDNELNREVALKQIRDRYSENQQQQARFVLEAEITGGLEHPGVVPVYSLGHYQDGRPFYAMRLIRGDSLKEAIIAFHRRAPSARPAAREGKSKGGAASATVAVKDASDKAAAGYRGALERGDTADGMPIPPAGSGAPSFPNYESLEFRSLMRRFIDICNAIAYAHSRGVLHRDLKPGNIMLGKFGETLVVDWGLAKLLGKPGLPEGDSTDALTLTSHDSIAIEKTRPGAAVGTPAYMSPEQAEGQLDLLGPSADIYSLGATFYTILTGRPPFERKDVVETLNEVRFGKFRPPRAVQPKIPKPLDAICVKAMALKPADRYSSALDLAGDIERWLADEPVLAWHESGWAHARRWMRKHPGAVAGMAATVLVGLAGLVANLSIVSDKNRMLEYQKTELAQANHDLQQANVDLRSANERQAAARKRAQEKEREARALVDDWFTAVSESKELKQTPNTQSLRKSLLQRAKEYYEKAARENAGDDETLKATAAAYFRLAYVTDEISPGPEALAAYERSLALRDRLVREHPSQAEYSVDLAKTLLHFGKALAATGKTTEAQAALERALAVQRRLAENHPAATEFASDLAATHNNIGLLKYSTGKVAEALAAHQTALGILDRLAKQNPKATDVANALAATYGNIGNLMLAVANVPKALEEYQKVLAIYERLHSANPAASEFALALAATHGNVGNLMFATGKTDQALADYRKALALYERLARENPTVTRYASYVADTQSNLGLLQQARGKADEAKIAFEQALVVYERLLRDNPSVTEFKLGLGGSQCNLGSLLGQVGDPNAALRRLNEAIDTLAAALAATPGHFQATQFLRNAHLGRARTYARLKQWDHSLADFDAALRLANAPTGAEIRRERDAIAKQRALPQQPVQK